MAELRNVVEAESFGSQDLAYGPEELLPHWLDQHTARHAYLALVDGAVVGRGLIEWSADGDDDVAWVYIQVLAEHRRRGIGSALLERVTEAGLADGKRIQQGFCAAPAPCRVR